MALQFEARKVALKQDRTGFVLTLSIHPDECPVELLRDFVGARYAIAAVRIQDDETPTPYNNRVQRAGMLCRTPAFQHWLNVNTEEQAADALCRFCEIESRTELNGKQAAQDKFDEMVRQFELAEDPF